MTDPFLGEVRIFTGNFPPKGWAFCNGQILPISQNTALFSLLGTYYGGDGKSTFALPNLQGSAPMGQGAGAGLTPRSLGESVGSSTVTLLSSEIPAHTHLPQAINQQGGSNEASGRYWSETPPSGRSQVQINLYNSNAPNQNMSPQAVGHAGGNQPHNNRQPSLCLNFIIALQGIFPQRP